MVVLVWLVTLLSLLLAGLFWRRNRHDNGGDTLPSPPGPFGLPWIGYLPWIDSKAPYETFTRLCHQYGRIYKVKLGGLSAVFLSDPALIRQAFNREVFSGRAPLYLTHGIMKGQGISQLDAVSMNPISKMCFLLFVGKVWYVRKVRCGANIDGSLST